MKRPEKNEDRDNDNDEFELEAEEAFRNVTANNKSAEKTDEFDADEFDDAFSTYDNKKTNESGKQPKNCSTVRAQNLNEENLNSVQGNNLSTSSSSIQRKRRKEGSEEQILKQKEEPVQEEGNDSSKPPLPEFALELITRQKSLKEEVLSPTHSLTSAQSNESSERGWSSDPDTSRHKHKKTLNEVKDEWEHVETVTAGSESRVAKSPMVSFTEAMYHFKNSNMDEYSASIRPTVRHRGLSALWNAIAGPPKLNERLKKDRDLIFTLALCPFDNHEAMHLLILQTIYKKLTATNLDCPRYGSHWESIGFQGEDPSTDLRGCGMLGLLTTLNFVTNPVTSSLAFDIYRLSEDEVQNFPFSVMGINITRISLQIFREGKLNKECNSRGQVFDVFNELYCAIYYAIYTIWKTQYKTISDSGFVIHDVETSAKDKPLNLMRNFQKTMSERKKGKTPVDLEARQSNKHAGIEKVEKFVGLCDLDTKGEEEVHLV